MKTTILSIVCIFFVLPILGQINIADSTVQVVAYWDKGEKQDYIITKSRTKAENGNTISTDSVRYDVELTVADSTATSYTMQWIYKKVYSDNINPIVNQVNKSVEGLKILYKTDELGAFDSVLNWEEIDQYMKKQYDMLRIFAKSSPEIMNAINKAQAIFSNKSILEASGIKEIKQFHNFYGGAFKVNEVIADLLETASPFSDKPIMADVSVLLTDIDAENDFYVMASLHTIDPEQLADMAYNALKKFAGNTNTPQPKREDIQGLANETYVVSSIHNWGWLIYSELTSNVTALDSDVTDKCIIEIK